LKKIKENDNDNDNENNGNDNKNATTAAKKTSKMRIFKEDEKLIEAVKKCRNIICWDDY